VPPEGWLGRSLPLEVLDNTALATALRIDEQPISSEYCSEPERRLMSVQTVPHAKAQRTRSKTWKVGAVGARASEELNESRRAKEVSLPF
jgi:hypothetical protein